MEIILPLGTTVRGLSKSSKPIRYPYINSVTVSTDQKHIPGSNELFLLDTGAVHTILNSYWSSLFEEQIIIDRAKIQSVTGQIKQLPMYRAIIEIKGMIIHTEVLLDEKSKNNYSVLGWHGFLEKMFSVVFFKSKKHKKMYIKLVSHQSYF